MNYFLIIGLLIFGIITGIFIEDKNETKTNKIGIVLTVFIIQLISFLAGYYQK